MSFSLILTFGLCTLLAAIPAGIWLYLIRKRALRHKNILIWFFLAGVLVPVFLLIIYTQVWNPGSLIMPLIEDNLDSIRKILEFFNQNAKEYTNTKIKMIAASIISGITAAFIEEIIKWSFVVVIDKFNNIIQTIGDALKFAIVIGLGFAFAENIKYLYQFIAQDKLPIIVILSLFLLRSIFSTAGHMVFSGIAGYFYGIGKFAEPLVQKEQWKGKTFGVAKILHIPAYIYFFAKKIAQGVFIAILIHSTFNSMLAMGNLTYPSIIVIMGALYILHLWQKKSSNLVLNIKDTRKSTIAQKDEEVILELMGMWIKEGKVSEVINICHRLLKRDPDNNVVHLFLAEAEHKGEVNTAVNAVKALFTIEQHKKQNANFLAKPIDPSTN